jgi:hypothetical protein
MDVLTNERTSMKLSSLSPEQRRVMLATADGWKDIHIWDGTAEGCPTNLLLSESPFGLRNVEVPRYDTDLNAVAALEAKLTERQWIDYQENLWGVCKPDPGVQHKHLIHASAQQRASALLLTLCPKVEL